MMMATSSTPIVAPDREETIIREANAHQAEIIEAAALFSEHYGTWAELPKRFEAAKSDFPHVLDRVAGERVNISPAKLVKCYLRSAGTFMVVERLNGAESVGHAIGHHFKMPDGRFGVWVSQLVVATPYRHQGIATKLLRACCGARAFFKDTVDILGLASSHPYAVRALEKATMTPVVRDLVVKEAVDICNATKVSYLSDPVFGFNFEQGKTVVNTAFCVDLTEVHTILESEGNNWTLGPIETGEEFVAIVFPKAQRNSPNPYITLDEEPNSGVADHAKWLASQREKKNDDDDDSLTNSRIPVMEEGDLEKLLSFIPKNIATWNDTPALDEKSANDAPAAAVEVQYLVSDELLEAIISRCKKYDDLSMNKKLDAIAKSLEKILAHVEKNCPAE
jgi:GNAT superfamily N-acetyltransferase